MRFYSKDQCGSNHSRILSLACIHFSLPTPHVWFFRKNAITKRAPRHPYRTRSKSRTMGDQEEIQEQMKADMSSLKEQMASMMDAMLGMRQLMENNVATAAAVSSAAEADLTLPATAHHPLPNVVGQEKSILGTLATPIWDTTGWLTLMNYHLITLHQSCVTTSVMSLPPSLKGSLLNIRSRFTRIMPKEMSISTPRSSSRG